MKTGQPIRVDRRRRLEPPGGRWETLDAHAHGRVEVLEVPDPGRQAVALVARLQHLHDLGGGDWSDFAVLAYRHETLNPIRALCESAGIPVAWRGDLPPLHRVREVAAFLDRLAALNREPVTVADLTAWLPAAESPWRRVLWDLVADWQGEAGEAAVAAARILEFCYETLAEQRRDRGLGDGVLLSTLHGAKGLEFPHVLIADGPGAGPGTGRADPEEQRRLYYVGMTRARETLALGRLPGGDNPAPTLFDGDWLLRTRVEVPAPPAALVGRRYELLSPSAIDLGYAGRKGPTDPIHARLAALQTGDTLNLRPRGDSVLLCDGADQPVGRLSRRAAAEWLPRLAAVETARVVALLRRRRTDGEAEYRDQYRTEVWEYPLVELVCV